jgi:hypothetical protein
VTRTLTQARLVPDHEGSGMIDSAGEVSRRRWHCVNQARRKTDLMRILRQ